MKLTQRQRMELGRLNFDELRGSTIGTVEFISPKEVKVLLELNAPQNTALNTGVPTLFPKINGYVLIPNEAGALVGIISWIGIENSPYPKRKGFKDFDLIDLPFPLRKMSVSPLGILKKTKNDFEVERGVYSYPSVGDPVIIPNQRQLEAIVKNKSENANIMIGTSPLAASTPVYIDPNKLFGRHVAVLGNTGSGKSCSVAGLIRWSLESAKRNLVEENKRPNTRFIILDPNGEYTNSFDCDDPKLATVRKYKVEVGEQNNEFHQLRVPAWIWNSYEWGSITQASGKTQRPILRRALKELRSGDYANPINNELELRRLLVSFLVSLTNKLNAGVSAFAEFPGKQNCGELLLSSKESLYPYLELTTGEKKDALQNIIDNISTVLSNRTRNAGGYYPAFRAQDLQQIKEVINSCANSFGGLREYIGPDEDSPVHFNGEDLPNHIERLSQEQGVQQYLDFLVMRIRTMLSDSRMSSIISTENDISLTGWLEDYIGKNNAENGEITIIDLSLVPSEIVHIVVSVIARIIFEALQRYRRNENQLLPTVLVMEEAHNFISRYNSDNDEISPSRLCTQTFERIAKEGRKFGLGLMLSSQRPAELSSTVLSQCNTFLLHRLVNDRDQELVKKFVPDTLGTILNELPSLPTKKAILLGWAAPIPILVDMNELKKEHQPDSKDPDFWNVWIGKEKREINWEEIVKEWRNEGETS